MPTRRVLVPVDGSELSLRPAEAAAELASRLGASVTLLTTVEPRPGRWARPRSPP